MADNSSNNKRIAKNTLFLYGRLIFTLVVSLYTSRVILEALGTQDFGLNNVVGGIISLFAIISACLNTATARFLTVELGQDNIQGMRNIYSNSMSLYIALGILIVILEETVGLYLVNYVLVIPDDRLMACNILYQTIVLSSLITFLKVSSGALIISYEKMDVYAYLGIAEVVLKLLVVFAVMYSTYDKLILFALLNLLSAFLLALFQVLYSKSHFSDVFSWQLNVDKTIIRTMLGFSFWNLIGSAASILRIQGVNILLNIFFGPIVNAANAIAYQVNSAVSGFAANFTIAVNPQITKTYASEEYETMKSLIFRSGKFTFYLLMILCFPILFETDFVLHLWLGNNVPEYTSIMTRLVLIIAMVETFTYSIGCAINATGNIKYYQLVICGIMLTIFPITWILFKLGFQPYYGLVVYLITAVVSLMARFYFMKKLLNIEPMDYIKNVYSKTILVSLFSLIVPFAISYFLTDGWLRFIIMVVCVEVSSIVFILLFGMDSAEKQFIFKSTKKILHIKS